MIGLVASLLVGIALKRYILTLAALPYLLRLKGRNPGLLGFSIYALLLITAPHQGSIYEWSGLKEAVLLGSSALLVLDDTLRADLRLGREELILSAVLAASALSDYSLVVTLPSAFLYRAYRGFETGALYFGAWLGTSLITLYALKGRLPGTGAEAFVLTATSLAFLAIAEWRDVKLREVKALEEE